MARKQSERTGRRIERKATPEERERFERAYAEESAPEVMAANRRRGREVMVERKRLSEAVGLLKSIREEQGVSLSVMEERTGMTRGNLSRLENMEGPNPTIGTLDRYARALGRTIEISVVET